MSTLEKNRTINIERTFDLPIDTVWKAWTVPESFKLWWGPTDFTCPHCSIDLNPGGKYLNSMKGLDGKEIWSTGVYIEITPDKKLVYTDNFADSKGNIVPASDYGMPGVWGDELIVTVDFEEIDGKTKMTLKHEGIPNEMGEECMKGWQQCFDKLDFMFKV